MTASVETYYYYEGFFVRVCEICVKDYPRKFCKTKVILVRICYMEGYLTRQKFVARFLQVRFVRALLADNIREKVCLV